MTRYSALTDSDLAELRARAKAELDTPCPMFRQDIAILLIDEIRRLRGLLKESK